MNNNVIGFIISGLLHASIFSGVALLNKEEKNEKTPAENKIVLNVKLFKTQPVKPSPSLGPIAQAWKDNKKEEVKKEKNTTKTDKTSLNPKQVVVPAKAPQLLKTIDLKTREPEKKIPLETIRKVGKTKSTTNKKTNNKPLIKKPRRKLAGKSVKKKIARKTNKPRVLAHPKKPEQRTVTKRLKKPKNTSKRLVRRQPKQATRRTTAIRTIQKKTILKAPRRSYPAHPVGKPRRPVKPARHVTRLKTPSSRSHPASRQITRKQPRHNSYQPQKNAPSHTVKARPKNVVTATTIQLNKQYKSRLQRLIVANKHYPKRAKRHRQQGKVTVSFRVSHSGIISNIRIIKSSNYASLDNAALQAIKRSSAKLRFLPGMSKKSLNLSITVSYILM